MSKKAQNSMEQRKIDQVLIGKFIFSQKVLALKISFKSDDIISGFCPLDWNYLYNTS